MKKRSTFRHRQHHVWPDLQHRIEQHAYHGDARAARQRRHKDTLADAARRIEAESRRMRQEAKRSAVWTGARG